MKEHVNGGKTPDEKFFGFQLSSVRMVLECTFGILKAHFGCLRTERTKQVKIKTEQYQPSFMAMFYSLKPIN